MPFLPGRDAGLFTWRDLGRRMDTRPSGRLFRDPPLPIAKPLEGFRMRRRMRVNKRRSSRSFRRSSARTKMMNVRMMPMRGGWRL